MILEVGTDNEKDEPDRTNAFLQRIPRSLKSLKLVDCTSYRYSELKTVMALVRQKERFAPDLKYLSLEYDDTSHPVPKEMIGTVWAKKARKQGLN